MVRSIPRRTVCTSTLTPSCSRFLTLRRNCPCLAARTWLVCCGQLWALILLVVKVVGELAVERFQSLRSRETNSQPVAEEDEVVAVAEPERHLREGERRFRVYP